VHNERCTPGSEGGGRKPASASWKGAGRPPYYSYVANNPLNYVDPSGFQPAGGDDSEATLDTSVVEYPNGEFLMLGIIRTPPPEKKPEPEKVGAYVPPVDVSPTGNTATYDPQPITTASEDGSNGIAAVELSLGFGAGVAMGLVPGGAVAEQIGTRIGLEKGWIEPRPDLQLGMALGQIFGALCVWCRAG
jgi:hypothetical protein